MEKSVSGSGSHLTALAQAWLSQWVLCSSPAEIVTWHRAEANNCLSESHIWPANVLLR